MKNGTLTVIPPNDESSLVREAIGLADMNRAQMGSAIAGLDHLQLQHNNLSGICFTLKGFVLLEAKDRLDHGQFTPFVKEHWKSGHSTANRCMRIAKQCLEHKFVSTDEFGRRLQPSAGFKLLKNDLATSLKELEKFQLDLRHPIVSKVAQWVNGRGSYQLMLDYPAPLGGHHPRKGKKLTLAEVRAQAEQDAFESYEAICRSVDRFLRENSPTLLPKSQRLLMASLFGKAKRSLDAVAD